MKGLSKTSLSSIFNFTNHDLLLRFVLIVTFLNFQFVLTAQERKNLEANPVKETPVIDGILSDDVWKDLNPATNFTLMWPETRHGKKIPEEYETTTYVGYDQNAVYVGAILKHPNPDIMPKEFSQRDEIWNVNACLLYTSPSPRDISGSRMPSSA